MKTTRTTTLTDPTPCHCDYDFAEGCYSLDGGLCETIHGTTLPLADNTTQRKEHDNMNTEHTTKHFVNIADALANASTEEQESHANAKDYNEREYTRRLKFFIDSAADGFLVIKGNVYFVYEMDGREQGLRLLKRVSLNSCIHNDSFMQVEFMGSALVIAQGRLNRDKATRRALAKQGACVTTCYELE